MFFSKINNHRVTPVEPLKGVTMEVLWEQNFPMAQDNILFNKVAQFACESPKIRHHNCVLSTLDERFTC